MDADVRGRFRFRLDRKQSHGLVAVKVQIQESNNGVLIDVVQPIHLVNYEPNEVSDWLQLTPRGYLLKVRIDVTEVKDLGGDYDFVFSIESDNGVVDLRSEDGDVDVTPGKIDAGGNDYIGILVQRRSAA